MVNKANEPVTAGRATEAISINNSYSGGITILIKNIKSSSIMTGSVTTPLSTPTTSSSNGTMELEKFTARLTCSGTVSWLIFADNVQN
ncbi:MAG: hypothetical protein M3044_11575 [Thermoproteota archaeon]|nr:hypothetical protein [Thermoproteota archaeon]